VSKNDEYYEISNLIVGISISVNPGEPVWSGLSRPDEFENWWRSRAIAKKEGNEP